MNGWAASKQGRPENHHLQAVEEGY